MRATKPVDPLHSQGGTKPPNNENMGEIVGLDISAIAKKPGMADGEEFFRWRKHHELMEWGNALAVSRGWEPFESGGSSVELLAEDLDRLEAAVRAGELADLYDRESYWVKHDLEFIEKARGYLARGLRIELSFSC